MQTATGETSTSRREGAAVPRSRQAWSDTLGLLVVAAAAAATWIPRTHGPVDLRWDAGVHYILGTSLASGTGYRLLNEPGAIAAIQYPPLLPAIVALHQRLLGTSDPAVVGVWLRLTAFLAFVAYAMVTYRFMRAQVRPALATLGSLVAVLCMYAWFLSDALYPEVWFGLSTVLFLMYASRPRSPRHETLAYVFAVASYAFRTIGIVAFGAWVLDSMLRRRWREAARRTVLVLVPVVAWQGYVWSVERSSEYREPAYAYQRAPYLFYNVSYARNIQLRDPFTPEKGPVQPIRRAARGITELPVAVGETLTIPRRFIETVLHGIFGDGRLTRITIVWGTFTLLSLIGFASIAGGVGALLYRGQTTTALYLLGYLAVLCVTPFPDQFLRYMMPIAPLLACGVAVLASFAGTTWRPAAVLGVAVAAQTVLLLVIFGSEFQPSAYTARSGRLGAQRLFFYGTAAREFDEAIDYLARNATPAAVAAAGTPHRIYLRTGLASVMPPFEQDPSREQQLLDTVPVDYLVVGPDPISSQRYTAPILTAFPDKWTRAYRTSSGHWEIYRRVGSPAVTPRTN